MESYDHYVAVDWAKTNMAIARLTPKAKKASVIDVPSDISELKAYLKSLEGKTILVIEETTTAQWLYVELKEFVDTLIICDPARNKLLSEGAKNDKIDAIKLASLLRSNLIKPVYHSCDRLIELRKLVSAYEDLVKNGVRVKNQKSALLQSIGKNCNEEIGEECIEKFLVDLKNKSIDVYEQERKDFENEFEKRVRASKQLQNLKSIPGIGTIGSVKIGAYVVDAKRFGHKSKFIAYCGLVRHKLESGGRIYGVKRPRYNRIMKCVFKTAALAAIKGQNYFSTYYEKLITDKRYPDHQARHAVARAIATAAFGVLISGKKFDPSKLGGYASN